jgi:hypothetical protein
VRCATEVAQKSITSISFPAIFVETEVVGLEQLFLYGEFDSGSERTLAAWIRHASRTEFKLSLLFLNLVADG